MVTLAERRALGLRVGTWLVTGPWAGHGVRGGMACVGRDARDGMRWTGCAGRLVALLSVAFALTGAWRAQNRMRGTVCAG